MLGDVLIIKKRHETVGKAILDSVLEKKKEKYIIAVSGESGSGKSELAHVLANLLKKERVCAKHLYMDNFYRIEPRKKTAWRKAHGLEHCIGPDEYDWEQIDACIDAFRKGKTITIPCIDIVTDQVDSLTTSFAEVEILVLDGLYAIKAENVDLRVFIELTYHETKKAQIKRGKEPQNEFRMQVLEQEHRAIQKLKGLANLLIDREYSLALPVKK